MTESRSTLAPVRPGLPRLANAVRELKDEELEILTMLAERMLAGQTIYAPLDVANDKRNLMKESCEELVDSLVYVQCETLRVLKLVQRLAKARQEAAA